MASWTEDWEPGPRVTALWSVGSVVLTAAGTLLFAVIYAISRGGEAGFEVRGAGALSALLITLLLTAVLLAAHEWVHGLTMRRYGARPEYGAGVLGKILPYFYCTAPGYRFTRAQFGAVTVAPLLVISLLGASGVAFVPFGGWLVVPLGVHLGGCIGDIWFVGLLARLRSSTLVEDLRTGVRFHYPA